MSRADKYINIREFDAFCCYENDFTFEGMTYANEFYNVTVPLNAITDSLDYIIQRRIDYITEERRRLINEQKRLKSKQKLWKSLNS